jgi:NADPH:quinone reductase-like Zn-dependent oxidoreductase
LAASPRGSHASQTANLQAGQRVLIHAAGGFGHVAVQVAKAHGAYVLGTAREAKHAFLQSLGADELIDYTRVDFADATHDIDIVLDTIGGDYVERSLRVLRKGGGPLSRSPHRPRSHPPPRRRNSASIADLRSSNPTMLV